MASVASEPKRISSGFHNRIWGVPGTVVPVDIGCRPSAPAAQHSRTRWPARMLPGCPGAADKIRAAELVLSQSMLSVEVRDLGGQISGETGAYRGDGTAGGSRRCCAAFGIWPPGSAAAAARASGSSLRPAASSAKYASTSPKANPTSRSLSGISIHIASPQAPRITEDQLPGEH